MSENNESLDNVIEEVVEDADVITVPIDATLTHSGEAADAKAVGDALANKADRTELQTSVKVNGQTADNQGLILVLAEHVPMTSAENARNVKQELQALDGKTAADIKMSNESSAPSIAEAIGNIGDKTAGDILMEEDGDTVKDTIDGISETVEDIGEEIGDEMSDEDVDAVFAEVFEEDEEEEA